MGDPGGIAIFSIRTTRPSATVRAFLDRYPSAIARLDGRVERGSIDTWCTNAHLHAAIDFSLTNDGTVLAGLPRWLAAYEALQQQKMLRSRRDRVRPPGPIRRMLALVFNIGRLSS
jgi:adenylate kinase family enzyme